MKDTIDRMLEFLIFMIFIIMIGIVVTMIIDVEKVNKEFDFETKNNYNVISHYDSNK